MTVRFTSNALMRTIRNRIAAARQDAVLFASTPEGAWCAEQVTAYEDAEKLLAHITDFTKRTALVELGKMIRPRASPAYQAALLALRQTIMSVALDRENNVMTLDAAAERLRKLTDGRSPSEGDREAQATAVGRLELLREQHVEQVEFKHLWWRASAQ